MRERLVEGERPSLLLPVNHEEILLPPELARHEWDAKFYLHLVRFRWARWLTDEMEFTPLKADYLRAAVPKHVERRLRTYLLDEQYLQTDGRFVKGKRSMGYKIGPR